MGRGMLHTGGFCTCEHLVWMKEATMIGARQTVNMPLRLAVFYPSIKDLRQIANGNGELELRSDIQTKIWTGDKIVFKPCTCVLRSVRWN